MMSLAQVMQGAADGEVAAIVAKMHAEMAEVGIDPMCTNSQALEFFDLWLRDHKDEAGVLLAFVVTVVSEDAMRFTKRMREAAERGCE